MKKPEGRTRLTHFISLHDRTVIFPYVILRLMVSSTCLHINSPGFAEGQSCQHVCGQCENWQVFETADLFTGVTSHKLVLFWSGGNLRLSAAEVRHGLLSS